MTRMKSVHELDISITEQQKWEIISLYNRLDEAQKEQFSQEWKKTTNFSLQEENFTQQLEKLSQQQYQTLITSLNLILVLYCPSFKSG